MRFLSDTRNLLRLAISGVLSLPNTERASNLIGVSLITK